MDRQAVDLAAEGAADRVADGGIDLAGDLGDRQPVGHDEVEIDRQTAGELDLDARAGRARGDR